MRTLIACLVLALTATSALAADSVDTLLNNAYAKAKAEKKNVLVKFSASWCGWCHKMDDFLTKTDLGKKVKDQFVVVTVIVLESEDHRSDENPGGAELLKKLGGEGSGIPYFAILNPQGKTLSTSKPKVEGGQNIGFPVEDKEIAHFMSMLKTGTKLNERELKEVDAWFKDNAKKIKGGG